MDGSLDEPPVTIRQSLRKLTLRFGFWLVPALALILALAGHDQVIVAGFELGKTATGALLYAALFVTATIAAAMAIALINPASLHFGPDGVGYKNLWGAKNLLWEDVEHFDVRFASAFRKEVIYNMSQWYVWEHPHEHFPLGSFSASWPMRAEVLAALLNEAKARWGTSRLPSEPKLSRVA